jgi:acyl-CoA synthetase (AMP-forming)/AMP-acid ligase II
MVMFPLAPLMHLSGQRGTLSRLLQANTVVLSASRSFDPDEIWRTCEREKVNVLLMSGDAMARPLSEALERAGDLSSLYSIASGAAIFSKPVRERFLELLPNVILSDAIGSSEAGYGGMQMVNGESADGVRVNPSPDTTVLVEGTWERAEPGVVGKLARTGNIPLGYLNDPGKTAQTFVEAHGQRWVVPGDNATLETDGTIVLLGRGSTCINTGGEKVYPEEVEGVLKAHPDVYDVLVVGVPDERWGEKVVAVVQAREETPSLEALQDHCRDRLAGYKVPRDLVVTNEVPRHATGKPDYPRAKDLAGA